MPGKPGVNINPPTALWDRLRLAAFARNMSIRHYCRDLVIAWLNGPRVVIDPLVRGNGARHDTFIPISGYFTTELRVAAARQGIGHGDLTLRILHATCPQREEGIAELQGTFVTSE